MRRLAAALLLSLSLILPAFAALDPAERLDDPALEARARTLSKELRCLVCQNQSIDDSDAELAQDLRTLVRDRLKAGDSDDEVLDYIVARYGEFVLMTPPLRPATWALWFGPVLVLMLGAGIAVLMVRRTQGRQAEPRLTAEEERRLRVLAKTEENGESR